MLASVEMMGVVVKSNPHHSELVEESRRTAAEWKSETKTYAANALISPLRSLTLATVEMMGV